MRLAALLLTALLSLILVLAPRADAYVYWVGVHGEPGIESATAIGRANLDGSGVKQDLVVLPRPGGGELAVGDTHLFWTNPAVGSIGRANLDGTGANQRFIVDVDMSGGVAVDEEHVYWVSRFGDDSGFKPSSGAIGRANLDGTGVNEGFITGVNFPAGALAVDSAHLYWTSYASHPAFELYPSPSRIGRASLDGTQVEESFMDAPAVFSVAIDDGHIWWTSNGRFSGGILRANLDGTGGEQVIGGEGFFPCGLAVDDTHLYWRGGYSSASGGRIGRAKLDGTRANDDFITGIGFSCRGGVAVDALGPRPSNEFSFGRAKKNQQKGSAKLTVKVPGPGELQLAKNKKVKGRDQGADAAGKHQLPIKPRRKAKQKLAARGKAKVKAKVTYTPDGGEPNTQSKRLRLVKRR